MKTKHPSRERNTARTLAALESVIADSTRPETLRRSAALRLSRIRRAAPQAKSVTPPPAPSEKACVEAAESFLALTRQRTALFRKRRRSAAEFQILGTMTALMPSEIPTSADPNEWRNFVAKVEACLFEIKSTNL